MDNTNTFEFALSKAVTMPMVRIDRNKFLEQNLSKHCSAQKVKDAIENNPAHAGIDVKLINKIADSCIKYETNKVSAISFASGLPGGIAMAATIPADMVQYLGHALRILQKLIYLYGWQEILDDGEELDDETLNLLTLFLGVMFGVNGAASAITKVSASIAEKASKSLASKALTKGTIYPIVKKVAQLIGVKMTKDIFAKGVGKIVPVVGGVVCGGLTHVTFKPMAKRLQYQLSTLKFCDTKYYEDMEKEKVII